MPVAVTRLLLVLAGLTACQPDPSPDTSDATSEGSADTGATTGVTTTGATTGSATTDGAFEPLAGEWSLELGAELGRTCAGSQAPFFFPMNPYVLENSADDGFSLAYVGADPIHVCTRSGVDFDCPIVMIGGQCGTEQWDAGFSGAFTDPAAFTAVATLRFTCTPLPNDTTGGEECCPGFGDVNPCTLTYELAGARLGR